MKDSCSVIILSAGYSKKINRYGNKSLINISGGMNVINRQLKIFSGFFPESTKVVICGYQQEEIEKSIDDCKNIINKTNYRFLTTNSAASLLIGIAESISYPHKNILFCHGDLVFNHWAVSSLISNCEKYYNECGEFPSALFMSNMQEWREEEVGVNILENNRVSQLGYGLSDKWGQIALLNKRAIDYICENLLDNTTQYDKMYSFEIINILLNKGHNFIAVKHPLARVVEIDYEEDIRKATKII